MKQLETIGLRFAGLAWVCLLCAGGVAGCGKSGPSSVSGTVTFSGAPVDMGTVEFIPTDGKGQIAVGTIEAGKYTVEVAPGPKNVIIEAQKKLGERHYRPNDPGTPLIPITQPLGRKELAHEVTPDETTIDFALP